MRKRAKTAILLIGTLFLTACSAGEAETGELAQDGTVKSEMSDEAVATEESESEELTGELTILSWHPSAGDIWGMAIKAFTKDHPGVTITVDCPEEQEAYFIDYTAKIITGEGYDIVQTDFLSMEKYGADQGLFIDLNEFMNDDEEFNREEFFSCIFEPVETGGKLFRFMLNVEPVYIQLNKKLLEKAEIEYTKDVITFKDLYELYVKVSESTEEKICMSDSRSYEPFGMYENGYFYRNNQVDSEEYKEYLQVNHDLYYTHEYNPSEKYYWEDLDDDILCRIALISPQDAGNANYAFKGTENVTAVIPYETLHGERCFAATNSLSISNFSENKDLAWEFLKFIMGEEESGARDGGYIPPNKEKTRTRAAGLEPEFVKKLFQDIEAIDTISFLDTNLNYNTQSLAEDYYISDILTAEEYQKMLSDRVYLYLNE